MTLQSTQVGKALHSTRLTPGLHQDTPAAFSLASLSRRERDVLSHLVAGASSKMAATVLEISPRTVDVYRSRILQKTGAPNIASLATYVASGPSAKGQPGSSLLTVDDAVAAERFKCLSRREGEVLAHLVCGARSKTAAQTLGISVRTVDVLRSRILRKTKASNLAAVATLAARIGWVGRQNDDARSV